MRVEAEFVDVVVAGQLVSQEVRDGNGLLDQFVARLLDVGAALTPRRC